MQYEIYLDGLRIATIPATDNHDEESYLTTSISNSRELIIMLVPIN
jgi:hypothetical protein